MRPDAEFIMTSDGAPAPAEVGGEGAPLRVARQPILDEDKRLLGYELLFHAPHADGDGAADDLHATSTVVVDGLLEIGLAELVGRSVAHVNVARDFLVDLRPLPLPADVILEVDARQAVDEELEAVLDELRGEGFAIALDHFHATPDSARLLRHACIVKVDVAEHDDAALEEVLAWARADGQPRTLVAEGVETREDFERCRAIGFDAFQGFFFARPTHVDGGRIPSEGIGALRAMTELNATEDFDELQRIIARDAGLSMRLLRYANSAFVALPRRVGSVQESLTWLGAAAVRRFALMVALSSAHDMPNELLVTALVRARMCELMCAERGSEAADSAFTVGLFSVADALASVPMQQVVDELPLREDVAAALLARAGDLGELLRGVIAYQYGNFSATAPLLARGCDLDQVYREAVKWADLSSEGLV